MFFSKLIATCFGVGYIQKGAGSIAALFCCLFLLLLKTGKTFYWLEILFTCILFFIGIFTSTIVEKEWGKDSNKVVIDEVQGMLTALIFIPVQWQYLLAAFILFRFFDIVKPLGIRKMEALPSGWGVMMDDLLAGIYSNVILHVAIQSHLF